MLGMPPSGVVPAAVTVGNERGPHGPKGISRPGGAGGR
jgi:hypothetical protein